MNTKYPYIRFCTYYYQAEAPRWPMEARETKRRWNDLINYQGIINHIRLCLYTFFLILNNFILFCFRIHIVSCSRTKKSAQERSRQERAQPACMKGLINVRQKKWVSTAQNVSGYTAPSELWAWDYICMWFLFFISLNKIRLRNDVFAADS